MRPNFLTYNILNANKKPSLYQTVMLKDAIDEHNYVWVKDKNLARYVLNNDFKETAKIYVDCKNFKLYKYPSTNKSLTSYIDSLYGKPSFFDIFDNELFILRI